MPSARPSGIPSGQPTNVPSVQPSALPSAQPSMQPSSMPTAQPSMEPTSSPSISHDPTSQPSAQPSSMPSGQPSGVPTGTPTAVPTSAHPTDQPTSSPSAQPTIQPTSTPTCVPTTSMPLPEFTARTARPSPNPTVPPTFVPTGQPTVPPTVSQSSVLQEKYEELIKNLTTSMQSDATGDMYSESALVKHSANLKYEDDTMTNGGCASWMTYWKGGDLEFHSIAMKALRIQVAKVSRTGIISTEITTRASLDDFSSTTVLACEDEASMKLILGQLTQTAETLNNSAIACNGHSWVIDACSGQGYTNTPLICIDCSASLLASMCSYTSDTCDEDVGGGAWSNSNTTLLAPCATSTCARRAGYSTARAIMVEFVERAPAPDLLSVNVSIRDDTIFVVNASLSAAGTLYCTAYIASAPPIDTNSIMLDNNVASTSYYPGLGRHIVAVTIQSDSVIPTTMYNITCLSVSEEGTVMTFANAIDQSQRRIAPVTTPCCKKVQVFVDKVSFLEGEDQPNAALVTVDFLPSTDLTLNFALSQYDANGLWVRDISNSVFPQSLVLESF